MELDLKGHLGLDFKIRTLRTSDRSRLLNVSVSGQYDKKTGPFLTMIVAAALANALGPGIGLIFNASHLFYTGGDELLDWAYDARKALGDQYLVAIVTSAQNHEQILSLIADLEFQAFDGFVCQSLSSVLSTIEGYRSQQPT